MNDSTGSAPLHSAEAVLISGPSLGVKAWLLCVEQAGLTEHPGTPVRRTGTGAHAPGQSLLSDHI